MCVCVCVCVCVCMSMFECLICNDNQDTFISKGGGGGGGWLFMHGQ